MIITEQQTEGIQDPDDILTYDYLRNLLEEEFEEEYFSFLHSGILHFELLNLQVISLPVFERYDYPRQEDNRFLRYELIGLTREYLNGCT